MFKELIEKLKVKKAQLQYNNTAVNGDIKSNNEEEFDITVLKKNNISKIEITNYISIEDYVKKIKSSEEYSILDLICTCVFWNGNKQKVNKGTYYILTIDNRLYNILLTEKKIIIDERVEKEKDEQTQKEHIIQERVITFYKDENRYHYYSAKHTANGDTYYTKYYNKNRTFSIGALDLSEEETYKEIYSVLSNLEKNSEIKNIINLELLNKQILEDLKENIVQKKIKKRN